MTDVNRLLQNHVTDINPEEQEKAEELAELGLCKVKKTTFIDCVNTNDGDYDDVYGHDCDARIKIDSENEGVIQCPLCNRDILLSEKQSGTRIDVERLDSGVYRYVRDLVSDAFDASAQKKDNGLRYLNTRFEYVVESFFDGDMIDIQIIFNPVPMEVARTIRLIDKKTISVLVGTAVTAEAKFDELDLPYLRMGELVEAKDKETQIVNMAKKVMEKDRLSHSELKASISQRLYSSYRSELTWREYEHCVQSIFQYIFKTSRILGGEESGEQVPDGVLSLNWGKDRDKTGQAYIWDAKYVNPGNVPRDLSGDYEDMAKHLIQFRNESNVRELFSGVSGFLIVSPSVKESSMTRLAERIQQRLQETGNQWGGSIVHIKMDALLELYNKFKSNDEGLQQKPRSLKKHIHRLFQNPSYHRDEPSQYEEADVGVFDVSAADIEMMSKEKVGPQPVEEDEVDIEAYLVNIDSLDY